MNNTGSKKIAGVRFNRVGKTYHFDSTNIPKLEVGDPVVVDTARGLQLGYVVQIIKGDNTVNGSQLKPINRRATPLDLMMKNSWKKQELDVKDYSNSINLNTIGAKIRIIDAEFSFDGARLTVFYSSDCEEKVDLKELRQALQRKFAQSQVELRQIGPRDVAKLLGGLGACGLECRCCSKFLCDFNSISIRMAKEQGISLTPSEITGICGRLRCCLLYEYDQYVEERKKFPKKNKIVQTPAGEGKVIEIYPLRGLIVVEIPDIGRRQFEISEIGSNQNTGP